jgi:hypothetical protein
MENLNRSHTEYGKSISNLKLFPLKERLGKFYQKLKEELTHHS